MWSVNGPAVSALPDLLAPVDLGKWAGAVTELRAELHGILVAAGYSPRPSDANWLLVDDPGLRARLARSAICVRDCTSFGLPGTVRIAVPGPDGMARLAAALGGGRPSRPDLAGGLMVCGTASDSGKSTVVAGLCRLLARRGVRVAPFKAQNMALNSAVTMTGHEIGRAQASQAAAAGVEAEVAMNPILLKPADDRRSQVVVMGHPWSTLDAADYQEAKAELWPTVMRELTGLRRRFDAVICEGAGSPAEINLLDHDITNLRVAAETGFPALLVGDIDRGGVFAALFGTVAILPPALAGCIRGFVLNKFRGDSNT